MVNMKVAQWDFTLEEAHFSGLHRYTNELYNYTSPKMDIERYFYKGCNLQSLTNYKSGDVTHLTTQSLAIIGLLKRIKNSVMTVEDLTQKHWYTTKENIAAKWFLNEPILDAFDKYIAISEYTRTDLLESYKKIADEDVTTIHLGTDKRLFYPRNKEESRKKFNLDQDKIYILVVSSDFPWKNLKIPNELSSLYEIINVGYGRGKLGYVKDEDMPYLYSACDVFLAPSKAEGFCLPAAEAMSCGLPVVASDATALPEIVGSGGLLVNPDDVKDWQWGIEEILSNPLPWSMRAEEQASMYSWEKCARETINVYKEFE
jgi:hypothetical protein